MTEILGKTSLVEIVKKIERSGVVVKMAVKKYGEYGRRESWSAANSAASGHIDGERFLSMIKKGRPLTLAYSEADTFPGRSEAFVAYIQDHRITGALNIKDCTLRKPKDNGELAVQILKRLDLDASRVDEYQFRICSTVNYSSTEQAIDYLNMFGMDRDLSKEDNLFWSRRGRIWGGLDLSVAQIVAVYHDPEKLMEIGDTVLDEGAMGYYGLVKADVTLRDFLVNGGVVIHNPKCGNGN